MSIHQQPLSGGFAPFEDIILGAFSTAEIGDLYREAERGFASITLGDVRDRINAYSADERDTKALFDWEVNNADWEEFKEEFPQWREYLDDQWPPEGWDTA